MSAELKTLAESLNKEFTEFKAIHSRELAEAKKSGEGYADTRDHVNRIQNKLDEIETKMVKLSRGAKWDSPERDGGDPKKAEQKAAFLALLRKGEDRLSPAERKALDAGQMEVKALLSSDDTTGGYLSSVEEVNEIIKNVIEFSPVREYARVRRTSAKSVRIPKRTGTFAAVWTAEGGTRSETTGLTYGKEECPTHELSALVDITREDLEDSSFDLEAELRSEFSEQFGVAEGAAFISGNSVARPEGILSNSSVGTTNSGHATQLTADGLIALVHQPKTVYRKRAVMLLNRLTIREIRKLKDGQGQYLWAPGLAGTIPATILDSPYAEATDLVAPTSGSTYVASDKPIIYGDFRSGYVIVDRTIMSVLRDPYTQAGTGKVRFIAYRRVGGQVIKPEALQILTISA